MSENFYRPTWSGFCIKFAKQVNGSSCFFCHVTRCANAAYAFPVCLSISEVSIVSERLDELSWFLTWMLPPTLLHKGNSGISKNAYFPLKLRPKLWTEKFAKTRRRLSLLTTITQHAVVGQLMLYSP